MGKFIILQETETLKNSYILGNGNSKKGSYISGGNLQCPKKQIKSLRWRNFLPLMTFLQSLREYMETSCETKNKSLIMFTL